MGLADGIQTVVGNAVTGGIKLLTEVGKPVADAVNRVTSPESKKQGETDRRAQSEFDYTFIQYPSDLDEGGRHPYYMTFYINKQELSQYTKGTSEDAFVKRNGKDEFIRSTVQINAGQVRTAAKNIPGTNLGFGRKTRRTAVAIRLFIPDTLAWSFANSFREASISGITGMREASAVASIPQVSKWADSQAKQFREGGIMGLLSSLNSPQLKGAAGPIVEFVGGLIPGLGADLAVSALGLAVNPQIDVIYQSPNLRTFTFDFLFAPRNPNEAIAVSDIIKAFKFHSAPEVLGTGNAFGRYFVPPSEFDIEFSVDSMGKISTCVLENITLDYAPSGVAFYENDGPVNTRMTLQFRELEFITKGLVEEGF